MKLKPCFSCGGQVKSEKYGGVKSYYCDQCGLRAMFIKDSWYDHEKSDKKWNTRTTQYEDIGMKNPFKDPSQSPATDD
jgi:hypothetical protein